MKTPVCDSGEGAAGRANAGAGERPRAATSAQSAERQLLADGSIELTSGLTSIAAAKDLLPAGMPVFVPSLPKRPITGSLETLQLLRQSGFDPVPHLAARRLTSQAELQGFLARAVSEAHVRKVLLIGGDVETPEGPYDSAGDVLRSGLLQAAGIAAVGMAAYPEPHPRISRSDLDNSLAEKIDLSTKIGLAPFVVTQFSLDPRKSVDLCAVLRRKFPDLPVFVGIPGPTSAIRLLRYAKFCGVGASLRALQTMGLKAARIGDRAVAEEQLQALADYGIGSNIRGVHLFSFGGFEESAEWIAGKLGSGSNDAAGTAGKNEDE